MLGWQQLTFNGWLVGGPSCLVGSGFCSGFNGWVVGGPLGLVGSGFCSGFNGWVVGGPFLGDVADLTDGLLVGLHAWLAADLVTDVTEVVGGRLMLGWHGFCRETDGLSCLFGV